MGQQEKLSTLVGKSDACIEHSAWDRILKTILVETLSVYLNICWFSFNCDVGKLDTHRL